MVAQSLQRLLEDDFPCVEIVQSGEELLKLAATSKPDLVLMDIGMPVLNGIETTRRLRKISPTTKIIIFTVHNQPGYVAEAIRAGFRLCVEELCFRGTYDRDPGGIGGLSVPDSINQPARSFHRSEFGHAERSDIPTI
jgi:CheY-like chemotaxis protein